MFKKQRPHGKSLAMFASLGAAVLLLSSCATSAGGQEPSPSGGPDAETLVFPAQTASAPMSYLDGAKVTGWLPEITRGVADVLKVNIEMPEATFENQVAGVVTGRYYAVSGMFQTEERMKTYDFVPFVKESFGIFVKAESPEIPDSMDALCGLTIAVDAAAASIDPLKKQSEKCAAGGKDEITLLSLPGVGPMMVAVQSGRADAGANGTSTLAYQTKLGTNGIKLTGPQFNFKYEGYATVKGNGRAEKLADAVNKLIASGAYMKALKRYGVEAIAITETSVNPDPNIAEPGDANTK